MRVGVSKREVVGQPAAAVRLDRPVDDLARHRRGGDLDHRDFPRRGLVAHRIHPVRRVQHQKPRLIDRDARLGDALQRHRLLGDRLAERHP